ncbi:hypothetical protein PAPYR_9161 [Paratrimastix pyriformis]|uniref:Uncharacterized protein n=1 Tax=Paratrimastix pyriformis TaxID=342808 RepID=A0ABQ8U913_9EUKA|nr:hypothetical protein PAPYR_9161 [Paratrimastix pyriformis]
MPPNRHHPPIHGRVRRKKEVEARKVESSRQQVAAYQEREKERMSKFMSALGNTSRFASGGTEQTGPFGAANAPGPL